MLFLGAGTSTAFGLPDLSKITDIVMKDLGKCTFFRKIEKLKTLLDQEYKTLANTAKKTDIETLLPI